MSAIPDYSKYSLAELEEAYHSVNRQRYPENCRAIAAELDSRKAKCAMDLALAEFALEEDGFEPTRPLLEKIVKECRDTDEAVRAAELIRQHENIGDLPHLEFETDNLPELELKIDQPTDMKLAFKGSAREYFRVWIVNLCLTLLSFGIYSAWAKVRKKRYIYSHTTLDGTPFEYLGRPVPILKGRIVAAIAFLVYYASANFFTPYLPYVFGAGLILAPWVLIQSASFNCRYTAFRNITFSFAGDYRGAIRVLSAWGLVPILVVGAIFVGWWGEIWLLAFPLMVLVFSIPWWLRNIKHFIVTKTSYGGHFGEFGATGGDFFKVYFQAGLAMILFGMISGIFVFTGALVFEDNLQYDVVMTTTFTYMGYIVSFAVIQALMTNMVWNKMRLGPLQFSCKLSGWEMVKIYLTNALGIIFSAGLLIPWAAMRTMRYRIEKTEVERLGELAEFKALPRSEVAAVGAEMSDFFDLDLGI